MPDAMCLSVLGGAGGEPNEAYILGGPSLRRAPAESAAAFEARVLHTARLGQTIIFGRLPAADASRVL